MAMLCLISSLVLAQTRTISGTVTSESGDPIPNASVLIKGTTSGTITNDEGRFSVNVSPSNKTLIVSAIGFSSKEVPLGTATTQNVTLSVSGASLDEVVVVGYGVQQKTSFTGSAAKIDVKEFASLMTPSVDKQLSGRAAGVQVTNSSGLVNQPARIMIRGVNSVSQGQGPLFVVDGVPVISGNLAGTTNSNALGDINPSDIESMDILKDGSATAIYGSRAAGGVILITTKKGRKGRARISYDGFYGVSNVQKKFDLLNAQEFVLIANEKLANVNSASASTPLAPRAFMDSLGTNTDWQDVALINNAPVSSHTLSLQGGGDKVNYYFSLNYNNQQGTIKSNRNKAYRIRLSLDYEANKFIKIGNNLAVSRQEDWDQNNGSNSLSGAIASALRLLPNVSPYSATTASGYNITHPSANAMSPGKNTQSIDDNFTNVAFTLDNNKFYSDKYRILNNFYVDLSLFKGLKFRSQWGADMLNDYSYQKWDPRHGDGYSNVGLVYNVNQNLLRNVWTNYFNYNLKLDDHTFFLTAGHEVQSQLTKWFSAQGLNIADLFFLRENVISGSAVTPSIGGNYTKSGFESYFGRINYDYKNRYFLQATIRRDGQSSLAKDKRYGNFPGLSVGWRLSEESFWQNGSIGGVVNEAKIKGSYAKVGNTLGGSPFLTLLSPAPYGNISGLALSAIGNSALEWETSAKYDVGIELGFLKNRITFMADYFVNDVNNLVLAVPTPLSAGVPGNAISQNIGSMSNKGIELTVNATVVQKTNFSWMVSANYSNVKNKVTSLYSLGGEAVNYIPNGNYNIIRVNDPYNIIFGYEFAGVNTQNGNPMYYKADGKLVQQNFMPGGSIGGWFFANSLNDGTLVPGTSTNPAALAFADRKNLGQGVPIWYGGISNNFTYKNLSLDFMFRYSGGNKIMNVTKQAALMNQSFQNNGREILDRWTTPGQVTNVPRLFYGQGNNINQANLAISRFVESGDYIRLQNVTLAYTLNSTKIQNFTNDYIQNIRLYAQGQNLFVWTKYSGADPDNISLGGVDDAVSPQIRTISFGINVGF